MKVKPQIVTQMLIRTSYFWQILYMNPCVCHVTRKHVVMRGSPLQFSVTSNLIYSCFLLNKGNNCFNFMWLRYSVLTSKVVNSTDTMSVRHDTKDLRRYSKFTIYAKRYYHLKPRSITNNTRYTTSF